MFCIFSDILTLLIIRYLGRQPSRPLSAKLKILRWRKKYGKLALLNFLKFYFRKKLENWVFKKGEFSTLLEIIKFLPKLKNQLPVGFEMVKKN